MKLWLVFNILVSSVIALEIEFPLGKAKGLLDVSTDVPVEAFLGIPYAQPPIGDLRFAPPQKIAHIGDWDATKYPPMCIQALKEPNWNSSENCLFLNVVRKAGLPENSPVIVLIHGGRFALGGIQDFSYTGIPLAAFGEVVVVSIQYRLGVFGFAQSESIPANLGLHDQKIALEWVHENIRHFGGDPEKVTLMGTSAGSMSISAHIISKESRSGTYFQSVIMDGGVTSALVSSEEASLNKLKKIASELNCGSEEVEMVKCLRAAKADDLVRLSNELGPGVLDQFIPTADGHWIPKNVNKDFSNHGKSYAKVRMLIGTARDEGTKFVKTNEDRSESDFANWCKLLSAIFGYQLNFEDSGLPQLLKEAYLEKNVIASAAKFVADGTFVCPMNNFIRNYALKNRQVYVYRFDRKLAQRYGNLGVDPVNGAYHGTPYLHFSGSLLAFGPFVNSLDAKFSLDSVQMISEFAKNDRNPVFRNVEWPDFSETNKVFVFDETPSIAEGLFRKENCAKVFPMHELDVPSADKDEL